MIIHLIGAPCSGKSVFAARFVLEHPEFRYVPIDEYRITYRDEALAWHELTKDVLSKRHIVLESCGMGWRLAALLNLPTLKRRPMITIGFIGDPKILHERLNNRQKRPLPPPFEPEDEHLAIDYHAEMFYENVITSPDRTFCTTEQKELETYKLVTQYINYMRLLRRGRVAKLRTSFTVSVSTQEHGWKQTDRVIEL